MTPGQVRTPWTEELSSSPLGPDPRGREGPGCWTLVNNPVFDPSQG